MRRWRIQLEGKVYVHAVLLCLTVCGRKPRNSCQNDSNYDRGGLIHSYLYAHLLVKPISPNLTGKIIFFVVDLRLPEGANPDPGVFGKLDFSSFIRAPVESY